MERLAEMRVGRTFKYLRRRHPPSVGVGWNRTVSGGKGEEEGLMGVDTQACWQSDA